MGYVFVAKNFLRVKNNMALTQIDFDDKEERIIEKVSKKYNLNKPKSIKKIILEYKEVKENE